MRSNIIQMLLNASSGKGGSSPGQPGQPSQPESEWTVVHFLMDNVPRVNCITFKTKERKWYYGTELGRANSGKPNSYTNFASGFGELLPWQSNVFRATYIESYVLKKDALDAVDSKGRPLLFALTGQNDNNYIFEGIFSVEDAKYYGSFTSNSWPTCTLPDGNTFTGWVLSVGIKVPASKLDSVTIKLASSAETANLYVIQDKNPDPKGQLAKFKNRIVWTKIDFSNDRLIKHIKYSKNINLYSETDNFGLTIQ